MNNRVWYAIYKGDEFIVQGTKEECAKFLGIKSVTIEFYSTPTWKKRNKDKDGFIVLRMGVIK